MMRMAAGVFVMTPMGTMFSPGCQSFPSPHWRSIPTPQLGEFLGATSPDAHPDARRPPALRW